MRGWEIITRIPFTPRRAIEEFHTSLADRTNAASILVFCLLATLIFSLFPTHLAWTQYRSGSFLVGWSIVVAASFINLFLYVLFVDMTADVRLRRKLIFKGLLSAAAISGIFSLLVAVVFEAGLLGLGRRAVSAVLVALIAWQGFVEANNIRRLYGTAPPMAVAIEVVARMGSAA